MWPWNDGHALEDLRHRVVQVVGLQIDVAHGPVRCLRPLGELAQQLRLADARDAIDERDAAAVAAADLPQMRIECGEFRRAPGEVHRAASVQSECRAQHGETPVRLPADPVREWHAP